MPYTLITPTGRVYTFYLLAVAKTWQGAYGGSLFCNDILVDSPSQTVYN